MGRDGTSGPGPSCWPWSLLQAVLQEHQPVLRPIELNSCSEPITLFLRTALPPRCVCVVCVCDSDCGDHIIGISIIT